MKEYELSVLFHPDLEMNLDPALDKVKKLIEQSGGNITKEENEGKKRLAYSLKGHDYAVYYYFNVSLPADAPGKISSTLNITDEVIRYLLVRVDERKAKLAARRKTKPNDDEELTEEKGE
jgi:small subunit ribosomal protein S6